MFRNYLWVLLLAAGASAEAQDKLAKGDKTWMEKEVGAIITAQEKSTFESINKDDRKLFKELFWMRRDYNPMSSENEFQKEYEARVKAADENFKGRGQQGSESDMGQVFLLLGGPNRQQQGRPAGGGTIPEGAGAGAGGADPGGEDPGGETSGGGGGDPFGGGDSQAMTWVYDPNPQLGIPDGLAVEFRAQAQFGYRLVRTEQLTEQLERVKERLITNPAVNYTRDENGRLRKPDARFDPNSPAKLALKALQETGQTSDAIAFDVKPSFFRAAAGEIYIPIDFVVTGGLSASTATVFGAVENADGFTISQFEEQAQIVKDTAGRTVWEMPLQLKPGLYTLYLGILDDGAAVNGTKIVDLDVPNFDAEGLTLSTILMFSEGKQLGEAMGSPGKAFLLGGYHFTPKRELVYTHQEQLSGVFNAYNYGVAGDKPNLTVQAIIFKGAERRLQTKDDAFMLQSPELSLTIFDIPLNLPNFKDPGDYKIEVKVTDHVTGTKITKEIPFVIKAE